MPELPEVETIVQQLNQKIVGKIISSILVLDSRLVDSKLSKLANCRISSVKRRAKYIIMELSGAGSARKRLKQFILIHLGMTGYFHYLKTGYNKDHNKDMLNEYEKYAVAKFFFKDGSTLIHNNIRRFGSMKLVDEQQLIEKLSKLGPEPLAKEFTFESFLQKLVRKKKANIKVTLMDQKFLSGIGNIYAQEILYHAGVDPRKKISSLSEDELRKIFKQLKKVLQLAVKHHGTAVENYVPLEGSGGFQKYLAVYRKFHCPQKHRVAKINLGGRGTYYCPKCQH